MSSTKCVVEGCNAEYDVVCSFSFYNTNSISDVDEQRQKWIEGAMQDDSECLWRHVSLQLCGYHFEVDAQGLWIDSPVLPELLTVKQDPVEENDKGIPKQGTYQARYEQFICPNITQDPIKTEHNYCLTPSKSPTVEDQGVSRLNVRQLVDTLGFLSLKNLQRKQLWVVKVESDAAEASITKAEQVIAKMSSPTKIIELIPPQLAGSSSDGQSQPGTYQLTEDMISDNFIYEIAEEQEISMDQVKDMPQKEWSVNILSQEPKAKYAFINCNSGKKKRHFTTELTEMTIQDDFDNFYILPDDVDTSVGVEVTTTDTEPETSFIVDEYNIVVDERPKKRSKEPKETVKERKKKRLNSVKDKEKLNMEIGEDWIIENNIVYDDEDGDKVNPRVRRKNKKYLGYDFVT